MIGRPLLRLLPAALLGAVVAPACSLGAGTGSCSGDLDVPDCWSGHFDLQPDILAAVPTGKTGALQIRIQSGADYESFSDGLVILVDDVGEVRGDPTGDGTARPGLLGTPLVVSLPPGVVPPGVPVTPVPEPRIVHATLYLERSCRTQNDALYALDAVTLNPDGTCARPEGGEPPSSCPGPATAREGGSADAATEAGTSLDASLDGAAVEAGVPDAGAGASPAGPVGTSTITFTSLFDDNPAENDASQRLTDATFDFYFGDPREVCAGGLGPPPRCRGHLTGSFRFYFQRGRPAQPFP